MTISTEVSMIVYLDSSHMDAVKCVIHSLTFDLKTNPFIEYAQFDQIYCTRNWHLCKIMYAYPSYSIRMSEMENVRQGIF